MTFICSNEECNSVWIHPWWDISQSHSDECPNCTDFSELENPQLSLEDF